MKTSSIISFLALSFSFFVVTSNAEGLKGLKRRHLGMMMMSSKKSSPPPQPRLAPTCLETCENIVEKPDVACSYLECIDNFECEKLSSILPGQTGFKTEDQCDSYCMFRGMDSCPQGTILPSSATLRTTSTPTSRCLAARCI